MRDDMINLADLLGIAKRNIFGVLVICIVCLSIALLALVVLPKKYKAKAVLNIQSSYFRNPLVSDLISEVNDMNELNAQRQSLLRLALNDSFLDDLASRYKVYERPSDPRLQAIERELFLQRIEYFSLSATTFQVSITASDAYGAFGMTTEVLKQMTDTFVQERYKSLVRARDAIKAQVQTLGSALGGLGEKNQSDELVREMENVAEQIRILRSKFTEGHPEVAALRQKERVMQDRMAHMNAKSSPPQDETAKQFLNQSSKQPVQDIFNDLLKKLSHLDIVLEMERDRDKVSYLSVIEQPTVPTRPSFPNQIQILIYAVCAAVFLSAVYVVYRELKRQAECSPARLADDLETDLLGELTPLPTRKDLLMIGAGPAGARLALPRPGRSEA